MSQSIAGQVSRNMLFRYRIPFHQTGEAWGTEFNLADSYGLPHFGEFDGQRPFADLRMGWNHDGILFNLDVKGKKKSVWCRSTQLLESDGLQLWFDTRDTHNVHRATRYCHWLLFLPAGSGSNGRSPTTSMLKINRAKEDPPSLNQHSAEVRVDLRADGYSLRGFIPGAGLNGWNPDEQRRIGFSYAVIDRELGWQTLASSLELPVAEDPSLWHTLNLVGAD